LNTTGTSWARANPFCAWSSCLASTALDELLADGTLDWDERFAELLPSYREQETSL
jgi:hypothetical protein